MDTTPPNTHLQLTPTADGSNTIYNAKVGDNYHSRNGALQESKHVFLQSGLQYCLDNFSPRPSSISILEVGFGTGLNFLLSADLCSEEKISLNYTGIEAYPLSSDMICQTMYNDYISAGIWEEFVNNYEQSLISGVWVGQQCQLEIVPFKLQDYKSEHKFELIYYDAFAAAHQPEMWDEAAIAHTIQFLKPGGVFVTYAITGNLKRSLKVLGLKVEKAPGAPGKREMLRAIAGF